MLDAGADATPAHLADLIDRHRGALGIPGGPLEVIGRRVMRAPQVLVDQRHIGETVSLDPPATGTADAPSVSLIRIAWSTTVRIATLAGTPTERPVRRGLTLVVGEDGRAIAVLRGSDDAASIARRAARQLALGRRTTRRVAVGPRLDQPSSFETLHVAPDDEPVEPIPLIPAVPWIDGAKPGGGSGSRRPHKGSSGKGQTGSARSAPRT